LDSFCCRRGRNPGEARAHLATASLNGPVHGVLQTDRAHSTQSATGWRKLWMGDCLLAAALAGETGEIPDGGACSHGSTPLLAVGTNQRQTRQDPLGHAPTVALRPGGSRCARLALQRCTLLVTLSLARCAPGA